jgi:hypothetical protein
MFDAGEFSLDSLRQAEDLPTRLRSLRRAVEAEVQQAQAEALRRVVDALNQVGHVLVLDEQDETSVGYHDVANREPGDHCALRVAADLVVSIGMGSVEPDDRL